MDPNGPPSPTEEMLTPRDVGRWLAEYTRLRVLALPPTGAPEARFGLRTSTIRYCIEVQATEPDYRLRCFVFEGNGANDTTCLNDGPSTERTLRAIMATILRNELVDYPLPVQPGAAPSDRPRGARGPIQTQGDEPGFWGPRRSVPLSQNARRDQAEASLTVDSPACESSGGLEWVGPPSGDLVTRDLSSCGPPRKGAMINNPTVIAIAFQRGPIHEAGYNGCQIEDVIDVLVERLEEFQRGSLACPENETAIRRLFAAKLAETAIRRLFAAKLALVTRTGTREDQSVEGTSLGHTSGPELDDGR